MEKKIKIFVENSDQIVLMSQGESLLDGLVKAGIAVNHSCGGGGTCGTCRVEIVSEFQTLIKRNEVEQEMADDRKFSEKERLACQLQPEADLKIRIPEFLHNR